MRKSGNLVFFVMALCLFFAFTVVMVEAAPKSKEICNNKSDDDGDGLIDCADPDCQNKPACSCAPSENPEVSCSDGLDNDCDGRIDGDDSDCGSGEPTTTRYLLTLEAGAMAEKEDVLVAVCGKRTLPAGCLDGDFNAWFGMNEDYTPCAEYGFVLQGPDLELGTEDDIVIDSCIAGPNRSGLNFYFDRIGGEVVGFQLWIRDIDWKPYFTDAGIPLGGGETGDCDEFWLHMNAQSIPVYSQKGKKHVGWVSLGSLHFKTDPTPEDPYDCEVDTCRCP